MTCHVYLPGHVSTQACRHVSCESTGNIPSWSQPRKVAPPCPRLGNFPENWSSSQPQTPSWVWWESRTQYSRRQPFSSSQVQVISVTDEKFNIPESTWICYQNYHHSFNYRVLILIRIFFICPKDKIMLISFINSICPRGGVLALRDAGGSVGLSFGSSLP